MKRMMTAWAVAMIVLFSAGTFCRAEEEAVQVKKTDWCEITAPVSVKAGDTATVTVKVLKVEPGLTLKGDMHYFSANHGYKGFAIWGGKGGPAKEGETLTFTYAIKVKEGMPFLGCVFYLSPNGEYGQAVKKANSPLIQIVQ